MNKKNTIIAIVIFIVAVVFRFLCIDKTGGLWYDEIVSFKEAAQNNLFEVIKYTLKTDVHLPFYPALLHLWTKIFSLSDISLRSFSAIFGFLTVVTAYYAGRELKGSQGGGLICAGVFALNSFLIYYSQEVRLYSLLLFLITLFSLFAIRLKNTTEETSHKFDWIMFGITGCMIIHTYTIAFLYVIPMFATLYFLKINTKSNLRPLNLATILFAILCIPATIYLVINSAKYSNQINGYYCDWSSLFILLQDWFSPVLEGLFNNPQHYMEFIAQNLSVKTLVFILLPIIISISVIGYAIKKDKSTIWLLIPSLAFLVAEILAFIFTNFKILPRYASLAMPNFLIILSFGLSILPKTKKIHIIIPLTLALINVSYLCFAKDSAFKQPRLGFRPVCELINQQNLQKGDIILVWNRKEILDKYVNTQNLNVISLLKDFAYKSERILGHEEEINKLSLEDRKALLRDYFADKTYPQNNIAIMQFIFSNMRNGQKFVITSNKYLDEFSPKVFVETVKNDEKYAQISYNDLLTIKSLIFVKEMCVYNLKFVGKFEKDNQVIFVFEK